MTLARNNKLDLEELLFFDATLKMPVRRYKLPQTGRYVEHAYNQIRLINHETAGNLLVLRYLEKIVFLDVDSLKQGKELWDVTQGD